MVSNIENLFTVICLITIVGMVFLSGIGVIYNNKLYSAEIALVNALEQINVAIQLVYNSPSSSIALDIYLPSGSWIYIEQNKITFSSKINLNLYDHNNIIAKIDQNEIIYKINFNKVIIANTVNKIIVKCIDFSNIQITKI